MSYLNPRKKQVPFVPRVETPWTSDVNKFGQKMLERMGWKSGQGLGKNLNGITNSIRASYKDNTEGLGFKEFTPSSVQQDNFNSFLQSLNKSLEGEPINASANDVPLNSLEKKSQQSRVRVHYRKVTRGKDISQYSEKDLANIFCKKIFKNENEKMQEKIDAEINGGHMDSYFKHKMENKKQSKHTVDDSSTNLEGFCNEIITNKSKKNEVLKPSFVSYLDDGANGDIKKNKKKRRKFKECSDDAVSSPFKKFRSGESEDSGVGIINPAFESLGNNVTIKMGEVPENSYEVKIRKLKKKKNFKKLGSGESEDSGVGVVNPAFEPLGNNLTVKKKALDMIEEDFEDNPKTLKVESVNTMRENSFELGSNTTINKEALDTNEVSTKVEDIVENSYEVKLKKKKKKNQLRGGQVSDSNLGSDAKSKKQMGIDNPLLNLDDSVVSVSTDNSQHFEVKRKKHKIASKLGVENVALNLSNANLSLQSIDNFKSPVNGTESLEYSDFVLKSVLTPQGNNKVKRRKSVRFSETNEEFLIPNRNAQDVEEKKELFEINAIVLEKEMQACDSVKGIVNNGFDIRSKDKSNVDPKNVYRSGIDNQAYDVKNQNVEEAIQSLTDTIDQYQAEVENGINESKAKKRKRKSLENTIDTTQDMAIQNNDVVIMKKTKKRKRQPEGTIEAPLKQDKACQVNLYEQSIQEEYVETNGVKSKRKKKRKTDQSEIYLHKIDETNGEIRSATQIKKETIAVVNVKSEVNNASEKIKSKKARKRKSKSQESLTEEVVADISKEDPNLQVKCEENNETADCDIMLNVTNEPVKTNANKDFFNDVHTKIENISRKRKRVSEPQEHLVLGDLESQIDDHERHEEGVKLSFKKSTMSTKTFSYHRTGSTAKTSYKHFIKGDLVLHFKNSNLHEVEGYGKNEK